MLNYNSLIELVFTSSIKYPWSHPVSKIFLFAFLGLFRKSLCVFRLPQKISKSISLYEEDKYIGRRLESETFVRREDGVMLLCLFLFVCLTSLCLVLGQAVMGLFK